MPTTSNHRFGRTALVLMLLMATSCSDSLRGARKGAPARNVASTLASAHTKPEIYGETRVCITDEPIVRDIRRFGMNLGDDDYWDSILTKNRIKLGGFEGIVYRQVARGPGGDARSFIDWNDFDPATLPPGNDISRLSWLDVARGSDARVLAGDRRWRKDKVVDILHELVNHNGEVRPRLRFLFESEGPPVGQSGAARLNEVGMLLEKTVPSGFIGQHGGPLWVRTSPGAEVTTEHHDLPPSSSGETVSALTAQPHAEARIVYPLTHNAHVQDPRGNWSIEFWAKGTGELEVGLGGWDDRQVRTRVPLGENWQYVKLSLAAKKPTAILNLHLAITNGKALLDDVSACREGDRNTTGFRDPVVAALKQLRPGVLRNRTPNGSPFIDSVRLPHERRAFSFQRHLRPPEKNQWPPHPQMNGEVKFESYGIHEFLELCEEIHSEPWYSMSGTIFPDEMEKLIEYLAGSEKSPMGQLRANRGKAKPWVQVFDAIHLEIGNEAWNWGLDYAYGGWNGPEYWSTLYESAERALKKYPRAKERIRFHISGQNFNTWLGTEILRNHAQVADAYAIAPYAIHDMTTAQANLSPEQLFEWAYGWVWYVDTVGPMVDVAKMVKNSPNPALEISVYEVNHHTTEGNATVSPRNVLVASLGGALNVINHMLLMLEHEQVRIQNFYNLLQSEYHKVKIWGSLLSLEPGQERYRPTYLALMLANQVLGGDLVRVDKFGANPVFSNRFQYEQAQVELNVPYLHVYATHQANERGLILINLHPRSALPVSLEFSKPVASKRATQWTLTGPSITANNEFPHAPEVTVEHQLLQEFRNKYTATLPPHSMRVIQWKDAN